MPLSEHLPPALSGTATLQTGAPSQADRIRAYFDESAALLKATGEECRRDIDLVAAHLAGVLASGGKVMLCGNGGSAADAQHCAAELVSTLTKGFARPAIAAIALTTDTSFLTAYANDFDFAGVFARQVEALGRPGDALILISTTGHSENLRRAAVMAAGAKMATIGVLGGDGGPLLSQVTFAIKVPGANTQHVQECHTAILHIICALVEERLYRPSGAS